MHAEGVTNDPAASADLFTALACRHGLLSTVGVSPDGSPERYLYSPRMTHRYAFGRWWGPMVVAQSDVWVLLNPATGDTELRRRPTLEKCLKRSRADGRTGVIIVNLFAHRDTDPRALQDAADPVGPANDDVLRALTRAGSRTIAAWGAGGRLHDRSVAVTELLNDVLCLGTTRQGQPRHPLYVADNTPLIPWTAM